MPTKDRADIAHLVRALDVIVSGACLCVVGRSVATHFALSVANSTSSLRPIPRGYRSTTIIIVTSCIFDALFWGGTLWCYSLWSGCTTRSGQYRRSLLSDEELDLAFAAVIGMEQTDGRRIKKPSATPT